MIKTFSISTKKRNEMIDITMQIRNTVNESEVSDGTAFVYVPHTTAAVTINENADPDVPSDMLDFFKKKIPVDCNFSHAEGNSDAHIKSSLVGCGEIIIVKDSAPMLGRWQGVFFCEFDGPRNRSFFVRVT
ncbi:MAG: secondary thiamine-phosphate synthase enzyme YjbQ [bacterium]